MQGGRAKPGADQIAVGVGLVYSDVGIDAANQRYFYFARRIGRASAVFEYTCASQPLRAMASRRDRLIGIKKVAHGGNHGWLVAQVFRPTATGNDQRIVLLWFDIGKAGVQCEVVVWLVAIGLRALKVVDSGFDVVAGLCVGAHRMHRVAHRLQGLEWWYFLLW